MSQTVSGVSLPQSVIAEDHRLERVAESSARELMKLRWHWTLDESNPKRIGMRAYARAVGREIAGISRDARAYVITISSSSTNPTEARERAAMSVETYAATEAVAKARGLEVTTVRQARPVEVRRVREMARERAEQRGTSVAAEAPKVAKAVVRVERAQERHDERHRERHGMQYIEMEAKLDSARRSLLSAAKMARDLSLDAEERDLLTHTIDNVRRLLELLDRAIVGRYGTRWEEELRVIEGGARG